MLTLTLYIGCVRLTIAAKVNHDIGLSVHDAGESKWSDVAPHFEGSEESIVYDFLVQVGGVAENSAESAEKNHLIHIRPKERNRALFKKTRQSLRISLIWGGRMTQTSLLPLNHLMAKVSTSTPFSCKCSTMCVLRCSILNIN